MDGHLQMNPIFVQCIIFTVGVIIGFFIAALMAAASYGDDIARQTEEDLR